MCRKVTLVTHPAPVVAWVCLARRLYRLLGAWTPAILIRPGHKVLTFKPVPITSHIQKKTQNKIGRLPTQLKEKFAVPLLPS